MRLKVMHIRQPSRSSSSRSRIKRPKLMHTPKLSSSLSPWCSLDASCLTSTSALNVNSPNNVCSSLSSQRNTKRSLQQWGTKIKSNSSSSLQLFFGSLPIYHLPTKPLADQSSTAKISPLITLSHAFVYICVTAYIINVVSIIKQL